MSELVISKYEAGQRFDKFLAKYMELAPKSFFYKMMRKKNITLNGKKAAGNEKLEEGDTVKLFLSEETIEGFREKKKRAVHTGAKLDILYEDEQVMLINKPAGMLSQKAEKGGSQTIWTLPCVSRRDRQGCWFRNSRSGQRRLLCFSALLQ